MGQANSSEAISPNHAEGESSETTSASTSVPSTSKALPLTPHEADATQSTSVPSTVTSQPVRPRQYETPSGPSTPVLKDRRNLAVSIASRTCCPSSATGVGCNCNQESGYGSRRVLPSNVAIYGTTLSQELGTNVVVTPPRCLSQAPSPMPSPSGAVALGGPSSSVSGHGCGHWCTDCRVHVQVEVECVASDRHSHSGSSSRHSSGSGGGTFSKRIRHKSKSSVKENRGIPKKKKSSWPLKLHFRSSKTESDLEHTNSSGTSFHGVYYPPNSTSFESCNCICFVAAEHDHSMHHHHHHHHHQGHQHHHHRHRRHNSDVSPMGTLGVVTPVVDLTRFNPETYPTEDFEEVARQERAREMAEGVELPLDYNPIMGNVQNHSLALPSVLDLQLLLERSMRLGLGRPRDVATSLTEESLLQQVGRMSGDGSFLGRTVHTQVDYIHCLVPDLLNITNCGFYWGKMDRYEAERLLEKKPEGTFLLRDSAQEEYLFSVSFRRYGRSLHARIEQWNHKFSFDSHDPGVFASDTVCGLIEHYKDPLCCMFFEPMLTNPLSRSFPFPLQHLCRAVICNTTTYDGINHLQLPKGINNYLKEYHYKQRVRVRRLEH